MEEVAGGPHLSVQLPDLYSEGKNARQTLLTASSPPNDDIAFSVFTTGAGNSISVYNFQSENEAGRVVHKLVVYLIQLPHHQYPLHSL